MENQVKRILFSLFLFINSALFSQTLSPQTFIIDGLVYGYNYNPQKKILQKSKQLKIEGVLDAVSLNVIDNGKVISTKKTNANGLFSLKLKMGTIYTIELSKTGYGTITFLIDLKAVPTEVSDKGFYFSGAELILNAFQSKDLEETNLPFGKLFFNAKTKTLDFKAQVESSRIKKEYFSNPISLMIRSVEKNKNRTPPAVTENSVKEEKVATQKQQLPTSENQNVTTVIKYPPPYDSIANSIFLLKKNLRENFSDNPENDIHTIEEKIATIKEDLERKKMNLHSSADSLSFISELNLLNELEAELEGAKKTISIQKEKITTQKQLLLLAIVCILLLSILLFVIYRFNKEKKKTYILLKNKNKKITDSINYALRIQESILPSDAEIKKYLPNSFVYFKPKDTVSGDFYWLSNINNKTIVACVDCTGHGVPGAFMSLIGNTLLNEIVNEKEIISASLILKNLHLQLLKVLNKNTEKTQSKDGMEMSICVIDKAKNEIDYAGAMNPIYIVKNNLIEVIKPNVRGIGGDINQGQEVEYTSQQISIEKNMCVYMFTDGYMDQFGGPENKKFNISNFKKMLLEMQEMDMVKQQEYVHKKIAEWQGDYKQIDDMLVMGIKF
ncbi:MAG: SpoIIE family protein phosphatase [Bacteroidia bacterium]|nr:SpoIIE family protein phosphatase [Bacteroidia bacterium]